MIEIEAPDGSIVEFPDGTPDAVIEKAMRETFGGPNAVGKTDIAPIAKKDTGAFLAAGEQLKSGFFGGFDDEIGAAMIAPITAGIDWMRGDGFDIGRAYTRTQKKLDDEKRMRRAAHPVASAVGDIAGGIGAGASLAKAGVTLAGRTGGGLLVRTAAGAAEGGAYGALYGAGEAKPGERLSGAGWGAGTGLAMGGLLGAIGGASANRAANKAANAAAPSSDDLAAASQRFYRAAENEGVRYKAPLVKRLAHNLKIAAGYPNDRLRPKTAGFMDDIDRIFQGDISLEVFDEFRKSLNAELRKAGPDDVRTLNAMKRVADAWADKVQNIPGAFTGDAKKAIGLLKEARQVWSQHKKSEVIERILDQADVDGQGRYTQSGFANAIKNQMNALYKKIAKGTERGWSPEEVALIRQMASGGSTSRLVNLMAKFSPRGVISILGSIGSGAGVDFATGIPGLATVGLPLAGKVAGNAADKAALQAGQTLRNATAMGVTPQIARPQMIPNRLTPLIPGSTAGAREAYRGLREQ